MNTQRKTVETKDYKMGPGEESRSKDSVGYAADSKEKEARKREVDKLYIQRPAGKRGKSRALAQEVEGE